SPDRPNRFDPRTRGSDIIRVNYPEILDKEMLVLTSAEERVGVNSDLLESRLSTIRFCNFLMRSRHESHYTSADRHRSGGPVRPVELHCVPHSTVEDSASPAGWSGR